VSKQKPRASTSGSQSWKRSRVEVESEPESEGDKEYLRRWGRPWWEYRRRWRSKMLSTGRVIVSEGDNAGLVGRQQIIK